MRGNNLILNNIPEEDLSHGAQSIVSDCEKVDVILQSSNSDLSSQEIVSYQRLGKRRAGKSRPLKIALKHSKDKYRLLNLGQSISMNETIIQTFYARVVFISCDCSFRVQKEEFRLRLRLKQRKFDKPSSKCYIRSDALYLDDFIIDKIDIKINYSDVFTRCLPAARSILRIISLLSSFSFVIGTPVRCFVYRDFSSGLLFLI